MRYLTVFAAVLMALAFSAGEKKETVVVPPPATKEPAPAPSPAS